MKHSSRKKIAVPALALTAILMLSAFTAAPPQTVTAQLRPDYSIVIDGTARTFYNVNGVEIHPISYNGTVYLPVRAIGELMGKNVSWNESAKTIALSSPRTAGAASGIPDAAAAVANITAQLRPDFTVVIDGQTRTFTDAKGVQVYPLLYQGSNYLPVRAIGELMGKTVTWDGANGTFTLSGGLVTDADIIEGGGSPSPTPDGIISQDRAVEIALNHAGASAAGVTFHKVELDREDGRLIYEVDFYTADYREFDYEIDAHSGDVLSYDQDIEGYRPPQQTGSKLTADQAKATALGQVPGAAAADVRKCELDYDDGRAVYEVTILYQAMEYEFEIDANTGVILSKDVESIYD